MDATIFIFRGLASDEPRALERRVWMRRGLPWLRMSGTRGTRGCCWRMADERTVDSRGTVSLISVGGSLAGDSGSIIESSPWLAGTPAGSAARMCCSRWCRSAARGENVSMKLSPGAAADGLSSGISPALSCTLSCILSYTLSCTPSATFWSAPAAAISRSAGTGIGVCSSSKSSWRRLDGSTANASAEMPCCERAAADAEAAGTLDVHSGCAGDRVS
ncbi:hypothetical protein GQ42DRAFT_159760 [Ramicandelaber brevisporus]|nr:hypothetical protein GQ42DRAFT_159760 [Ramicandelaber brevisporus]